LVVVTLGRHGAMAHSPAGSARVAAPPPGPFPVGSGDAFLAGLLYGLGGQEVPVAGPLLEEALRLATAAGAVNARVLGAGSVDPELVRAAMRDVVVVPLA
jgi:sugar/nucleoside kinase (ribokinase family)